MASDLYMKVPDVPGESIDADHKDWIPIDSVNFGMSMPMTGAAQAGQRHNGCADFGEVSVSKVVDKSSTKLFFACCTGKVFISDVIIDFVQPMGTDKRHTYLQLKLLGVVFSSYSISSGQASAYENVTLNFSKYTMSYNPQKDDKAVGAIPALWNVANNSKD